jgi:putative membrane protein
MTAILLAPIGGLAIVWGFMGIAFWILLIALIVLLVRGTRPSSARDSGGPAARLLEERYARGEITREDFLERRAVLGGSSPGAPGDDPR